MEENQQEQIDLRDYFRVLLKRRWLILTVFTLIVLSVAIHTFSADYIYQATSRIVIEKENPNLVSIQEVLAVDATDAVGVDTGPLLPVVTWTVLLSIVLHGLSARPLAAWYGRYVAGLPQGSPEFLGETEPRMKGAMWSMHHHEEAVKDRPA